MPRLPEIFERDQLPEDKRDVYDYLVKARGRISNGYAQLLHCPELVGRTAHLGTYVRFESSLEPRTIELLAFATSAELDNPYERDIHAQNAAKLGVSQATIDAVQSKADLADGPAEELLLVRCVRELIRTHQLSDAAFAAAHAALGDKRVVELIGTIGYYAMLAYAHNAVQVRPRGS
jgi:4-carboxymuconolactone decarboxylase